MFATFMAVFGMSTMVMGASSHNNKSLIVGFICLIAAGVVWWRESR